MTNFDLQQIENNLNKFCTDYPSLAFLLKEKLKNFAQRNAMTLKIAAERRAEYVKKFCLHDEAGKPLLIEKEGNMHYTFATTEDEKEYINKLTEFNNRTVYVES